jgi:plastocyanin
MKLKQWSIYSALFLSMMVAVSGCGKKHDDFDDDDDNGGGSKTEAPATAVDPATAATVSGSVVFEGTPPAPSTVKMDADPVCSAKASTEGATVTQEVAVKDGKLANVFVYVSGGLEGKTFPTPTDPVTITQEGCRYHPHVLGIMVGQPLKITNGDQTLHNIHATPTKNAAFNIAQSSQGAETEKKFDQEEVMVPVSCDVHGWMHSFIGVLTHPFYSVSAEDGSFSLKGLPPGDYTVTAWHEKYGKQDQKVTVGPKETKSITFTFKAQ